MDDVWVNRHLLYKTVKIGEQVWMAENLNYEAEGSRCYGEGGKLYNEKTKKWDIRLSNAEIQANCTKYGRLYNWEMAMKACPSGWHLPDTTKWQTLVDLAGGNKIAGKKLKAKSSWNNHKGKSGNGIDAFGFSSLSGGFGTPNEISGYGMIFTSIGLTGNWWIAGEDGGYASGMCMSVSDYSRMWSGYIHRYLHSIRCIQD